MGIELRPDLEPTICHGYEYFEPTGEKKVLAWRENVIGTLTDKQERELCSKIETKPMPPKLKERFIIMRGLRKGYPYCFDKEEKELMLMALDEYKKIAPKKKLAAIHEAIESISLMPECP